LQIERCKLQIDGCREIHRGITLVELLVAISILVLLMAVGARMINFSKEDRLTREAARAVNVYFSSARNRALESGRPCGVMLRRVEGLPQCAEVLDQVEVPPPYAGDTLGAVAQVSMGPVSGGLATVSAQLTPEIRTSVIHKGELVPFISKGDLVQFNHQGPFYAIAVKPTEPTATSLTLQIDLSQGQRLPWPQAPAQSARVPYQIIRRPRKSTANTLDWPKGAVIDLEFSGADDHSIGAGAGEPVYIMFSPNGSVERVYHRGYSQNDMHMVTEPIFLLVGKRERVPVGAAEDGRANWEDTNNFWVMLNPQTGLIATAEVAKVAQGADWRESRAIAREGQSMGGR
jgi:prepilin-type N-terminal cleavage/methylation domain-containing protein